MPDAHLGSGATVGSVIVTRDALIPAAVGVDVGCGIFAAETGITVDEINQLDFWRVHRAISEAVPSGVGRGFESRRVYHNADERDGNAMGP